MKLQFGFSENDQTLLLIKLVQLQSLISYFRLKRLLHNNEASVVKINTFKKLNYAFFSSESLFSKTYYVKKQLLSKRQFGNYSLTKLL